MMTQEFLSEIHRIEKEYSNRQEIVGDNFNVFDILKTGKDELFHSRFISNLLNPKGNHNKKTLFFKYFLSIIGIKNFPLNNIKIEIEKFIGYIDKNYDTGGRIDIIITNRKTGRKIIIENKLDAGDEYKQLQRYKNYDRNAHIVYLTLFGTEASANSVGENNNFKYTQISYSVHILNWINDCICNSDDNSTLKQTLIQYKRLIEKITLQTRSIEMENDIINLIMNNKENFKSALIIVNNIHESKERSIKKYLKPELIIISKKYDLILDFDDECSFERYWGWSMYKSEWKSLRISFEFQSKDYNDLIYGFSLKKPCKSLDNYLRKLPHRKSKVWALYEYFDEYQNWNEEVFPLLLEKKNDVLASIEDKINELLKLVKNRTDL